MNKKLKYLAAIPLYGTCILLIYMFVLCLKEEISKKDSLKYFYMCNCFCNMLVYGNDDCTYN